MSCIILGVLLISAASGIAFARPGEINGTATHVIDGDTFDILASNGTEYRIRMADINAVEMGQTGYDEAKAALNSMIAEKFVYFDVDDLYQWDNRGTGERLVAVTYIDHNSTHFLNVNEEMFLNGYVEKRDYSNEFYPENWTLYEPRYPGESDVPLSLLAVMLAVALLVAALFFWRNIRKG